MGLVLTTALVVATPIAAQDAPAVSPDNRSAGQQVVVTAESASTVPTVEVLDVVKPSSAGHVFLQVTVLIENTGSDQLPLDESTAALIDDAGTRYDSVNQRPLAPVHLFVPPPVPTVTPNVLAPEQQTHAKLTFEVP